jgi:hypothetical protein
MTSTAILLNTFVLRKRLRDVISLNIFRCAYTSMINEIESFKKMKGNIFENPDNEC